MYQVNFYFFQLESILLITLRDFLSFFHHFELNYYFYSKNNFFFQLFLTHFIDKNKELEIYSYYVFLNFSINYF